MIISFQSIKRKKSHGDFSGTMNSGGSKVGGFGSHAATGGVGIPYLIKQTGEKAGNVKKKWIQIRQNITNPNFGNL